MRPLTLTGETLARMDRFNCLHDYLAIRIEGFLKRGELVPTTMEYLPSPGADVRLDRAMEAVQMYRAMVMEVLDGG